MKLRKGKDESYGECACFLILFAYDQGVWGVGGVVVGEAINQ